MSQVFIEASSASYIPANGNLVFYVSTTGSDSNPGTITEPFATIQHAFDVTGLYDYQLAWFPTINIGPGTFGVGIQGTNETGQLHNIDFQLGLVQGAGVDVTYIGDPGGPSSFEIAGQEALWSIGGFTSIAQQVCFFVTNFATLEVAHNLTGDIGLGGMGTQQSYIAAQLYANVLSLRTHVTVEGNITGWMAVFDYSSIIATQGVLVFPVSTSMGAAFYSLQLYSYIREEPSSTVNFGGITGGGLTQIGNTHLETNNGVLSDVGGGVLNFSTPSEVFLSAFSLNGGNYFNKVSGAPTTTNVAAGYGWFFKDNTQPAGTGVTVAYNDAGTMALVTLGGLSTTITTAKLTGGGSNGSMTFTNGVLTASTPAT